MKPFLFILSLSLYFFSSCSDDYETINNGVKVLNSEGTQVIEFNGKTWMTDLYTKIKNKKLWEISATGSHNAFNYYGRELNWKNYYVYPATIYYNHYNSPVNQFNKGVRYFDTRFEFKKNTIRSYHGSSSKVFNNNSLVNDFKDLSNALRGSKEIIILQLNQDRHLITENNVTQIDNRIFKILKEEFGNLIIKSDEVPLLKEATIEELTKHGNIIILSPKSIGTLEQKTFLHDDNEFMNYLDYGKQVNPEKLLLIAEKSIKIDDEKIHKLGYCYDPMEGDKWVNLHDESIRYNKYFLNHTVKNWLKKNYHFYLSMDFTSNDQNNSYNISKEIYEYYRDNLLTVK